MARSVPRVAKAELDTVMRAARVFGGVVAASLAHVEDLVSPAQLRVLVIVGTHDAVNATAVAEALDIHPSSGTRLCDRLVAAGYLSRRGAAVDRRNVLLELTPAGSALRAAIMEHRRSALNRILAAMTAADRRALQHSLAVFCDAAQEPEESSWDTGVVRLAHTPPASGAAAPR